MVTPFFNEEQQTQLRKATVRFGQSAALLDSLPEAPELAREPISAVSGEEPASPAQEREGQRMVRRFRWQKRVVIRRLGQLRAIEQQAMEAMEEAVRSVEREARTRA